MFNPFDWTVKMADTVQEALKSNDVELIKRTRTTFKGKLTRAANVLVAELKKDENGKFVFDEINSDEVASLLSNLQRAKDVLEELHVRFTVKRVHAEGQAEDILEQADEEYASVFEKTHRDALKVYHAYSSQLKAYEQLSKTKEVLIAKCAQYPDKVRRFRAKIIEYESAHEEAKQVIESEDEYIQRTASMQKDMLIKEYQELIKMGQDLLEMLPNVTGTEPGDKELFECSKEKLTYRKTLTSLEKVIKKFEVEDKERLAKVTPAPMISSEISSSAASGHVRDSSVLKIKVSAPKFSGKSREFAVFKRDFQAIVAVEKRNAVEIGALLKESVPDNYKYILDKFDLNDHEKMMDALTEKFGRARIIVDECTSEIKRMSKLTNDSDFIKFVDHLDKLKRDLSQLGLLSDVANTTVISKNRSQIATYSSERLDKVSLI